MSATLVPLSACRNARRICSSVCPFFATFVSSSFSSRGPRLPLLTQLARGSLFGFWVMSVCGFRFPPFDRIAEAVVERPSRLPPNFFAYLPRTGTHHWRIARSWLDSAELDLARHLAWDLDLPLDLSHQRAD